MMCQKCGTGKITKKYKKYCKNCSKHEQNIERKLRLPELKVTESACNVCGGQMDEIKGKYGIFYKCQKKSCGEIKTGSKKLKPNNEMQQILDSLDNRKKAIKKRPRAV